MELPVRTAWPVALLALTVAVLVGPAECAAGADQSETEVTFVIPLPELTGYYQPGQMETVLVDPTDWAFSVETAHLWLNGNLWQGQAEGFAPQPEMEVGISTDLMGSFVSVYQQQGHGPLDQQVLLAFPFANATNFLTDGPGQISIFLAPVLGPDLTMTIPPSMYIDDAQLVLQGQSTPEPATLVLLATGGLALLLKRHFGFASLGRKQTAIVLK